MRRRRRNWRKIGLNTQLVCGDCGLEYPTPEPRLYSFNSPLGACPQCEGFGNVIDVDMELVVPDPSKSIREGAIAPWNSPAYAHELKELWTWPAITVYRSTCLSRSCGPSRWP